MAGTVVVDEFVIGSKETGKVGRRYDSKKEKVVITVALTKAHKVVRIYSMPISDFSAASLVPLWTQHISSKAGVIRDEWKAYKRLSKAEYGSIKQYNSKKASSEFFKIRPMLHQVKSMLRTIYSWVSPKHLSKYLDEIVFRINRSQTNPTIVNTLLRGHE